MPVMQLDFKPMTPRSSVLQTETMATHTCCGAYNAKEKTWSLAA